MRNRNEPSAAESRAPGVGLARLVEVETYFCCPVDLGELELTEADIRCRSCGASYPVLDGRAVLIDESRSIFANRDLAVRTDHRQFPPVSGWKALLRRVLPASGATRDNGEYLSVAKEHMQASRSVLVIGCGFTRSWYTGHFPEGDVILTDVTLQGDADIACDGQCLPFKTGSFDLIILDQVLEHVVDLNAVLAETERCLKMGGLVYSGVPFFFPNHGFPYDFRRFTPLGHRLLYPRFGGIGFWTAGGPFGALSLAAIGAGSAIHENLQWRRIVSMLCRLLLYPLARFDPTPAWDKTTVALGSVFIGRKQIQTCTFQEMLDDVGVLSKARPRATGSDERTVGWA